MNVQTKAERIKGINEFLKKTLDTYMKIKNMGDEKTAVSILKIGSTMAEMELMILKALPVYCPSCQKELKTDDEVTFTNDFKECLNCYQKHNQATEEVVKGNYDGLKTN